MAISWLVIHRPYFESLSLGAANLKSTVPIKRIQDSRIKSPTFPDNHILLGIIFLIRRKECDDLSRSTRETPGQIIAEPLVKPA
jgi:hypothetical protein